MVNFELFVRVVGIFYSVHFFLRHIDKYQIINYILRFVSSLRRMTSKKLAMIHFRIINKNPSNF